MAVREYLNNNPAVVTIAAVVLLIVCLALIVRQLLGGGGGQARDMFYLDTATGQVFIESAAQFAPIDAPSGAGNGVRAHIYSCGDCDDIASDIDTGMTAADIAGLGAKLLYVERMPPEALASYKSKEAAGPDDPSVAMAAEELSNQVQVAEIVDGVMQEWQSGTDMDPSVDAEQMWGVKITRMLKELCPGGERPSLCLPPR
ncbi:MAG: hypothetical protein AAF750_10550 [Planctomycetota bacterium]